MEPPEPVILALCLDGGGVRIIYEAIFLQKLQENLRAWLSPNFAAINIQQRDLLRDTFHYIAGSSTGGFAALCLTSLTECNDIPKFLREIFVNDHQYFFPQPKISLIPFMSFAMSLLHSLVREASDQLAVPLDAALKPRYSRGELDSYLEILFKTTNLDHRGEFGNVFVPLWEIEAHAPVYISNQTPEHRTLRVSDIAKATFAFPPYFGSHRFLKSDGNAASFADGSIFSMNPSPLLLSHIMRINPNVPLRNILIISVGTLDPIPEAAAASTSSATSGGLLDWRSRIVSCMQDGSLLSVDFQMQALLGENYLRFKFHLPHSYEFDHTASTEEMEADAERILAENEPWWDALRARLVQLAPHMFVPADPQPQPQPQPQQP